MDSGKQQILHYFIEEAKEHLETLEKGLLDLRSVVEDEERIREMFRAAHSIKGGAAMLGFTSIQKTGHRLEDSFKILQEHPIHIDQKLETLFLAGYDTMKGLVERLQGPFGLRDDEADKIVQDAEPNFVQLQNYLNHLVAGGESEPSTHQVASAGKTTGSVPSFTDQVVAELRQMLQLFKENPTTANRQQLAAMGDRLLQLNSNTATWKTLIQTTQKAIANPNNSYRLLASLAIKEIKQASELIAAGKADAIAPSPNLKQLVNANPGQKQVLVAVEPQAAAKSLIQAFNKQQLSQLVQLLQTASR